MYIILEKKPLENQKCQCPGIIARYVDLKSLSRKYNTSNTVVKKNLF